MLIVDASIFALLENIIIIIKVDPEGVGLWKFCFSPNIIINIDVCQVIGDQQQCNDPQTSFWSILYQTSADCLHLINTDCLFNKYLHQQIERGCHTEKLLIFKK